MRPTGTADTIPRPSLVRPRPGQRDRTSYGWTVTTREVSTADRGEGRQASGRTRADRPTPASPATSSPPPEPPGTGRHGLSARLRWSRAVARGQALPSNPEPEFGFFFLVLSGAPPRRARGQAARFLRKAWTVSAPLLVRDRTSSGRTFRRRPVQRRIGGRRRTARKAEAKTGTGNQGRATPPEFELVPRVPQASARPQTATPAADRTGTTPTDQ